jgi:hypothetical protein
VDTFYFILCWFQRQPTGLGSVAIVPWLIPVGGAELAARTGFDPYQPSRLEPVRLVPSGWYRSSLESVAYNDVVRSDWSTFSV